MSFADDAAAALDRLMRGKAMNAEQVLAERAARGEDAGQVNFYHDGTALRIVITTITNGRRGEPIRLAVTEDSIRVETRPST